MNNVKVYLLTLITTAAVTACQNDDDVSPTAVAVSSSLTNSDYLPGKKGSTWIYEVYEVDTSDGSEVFLGNDTMIVSDSTIDSVNYRVYSYKFFPIQTRIDRRFMRDSSGLMINQFGEIVFTTQLLDSVIREQNFSGLIFSYKMEKDSISKTVPAGNFADILNYKTIFSYDSILVPTLPPDLPPKRFYDKIYAKDVGLIFETWDYISLRDKKHFERRLVSYNLIK